MFFIHVSNSTTYNNNWKPIIISLLMTAAVYLRAGFSGTCVTIHFYICLHMLYSAGGLPCF